MLDKWTKKYLKDYNIIDKKFGKLKVIKLISVGSRGGRKKFECKCECGKNFITFGYNLLSGKTISCGCIRKSDLIGKKFGKLTVIRKENTTPSGKLWLCMCDCGNKTTVRTAELYRGSTKSCGCLNLLIGESHHNWKGFGEISGTVMSKIRNCCKRNGRNLDFNVNIEYLSNLLKKQDNKCALTGVKLTLPKDRYQCNDCNYTASLDRIDSNKGYIEGNVQWIHKVVNVMKSSLKDEDLVCWSKKIFLHSLFKNRPTWDEYFMELCKLISTRSLDPSTKHGCVIVDENNRLISSGYNGAIQGIDDTKIPTERPQKYPFFLHSEENAVAFANGKVENCTVYVTGMPCSRCLRLLLQLKVSKIIYGEQNSHCIDDTDLKASLLMLSLTKTQLIPFKEKECIERIIKPKPIEVDEKEII